MKPYYADDSVTLYHGDALAALRALPDASVNCCVTSPPYFGLRDYGEDDQYGLEASPAEYVEAMRAVFAEVRRVLADDGTLWLNIGDSYASTASNNGGYSAKSGLRDGKLYPGEKGREANDANVPRALRPGVPAKNLLGVPWRTAFALQDDGWILRNDVIWSKPNAMPESVTDRLSTRHEHLFMLSKSPRYWFDLDPIREQHAPATAGANPHGARGDHYKIGRDGTTNGVGAHPTAIDGHLGFSAAGRNPGDVWTIPTQPFAAAHFAVMPQALAERAILAGCKPCGVVLDPFSGSGTTGLAATKHGRKYIGIDLSATYLDLSLRTRFAQPGFMFGEEPA